MTRVFAIRRASRLTTTVVGLAISLAASLPAQQTTQYGPFRITAGRWHDIGLYLKKGESFYVQANGLMQHYTQQFWPNGYQLQNGNVAGKLYVLSGSSTFPVGAAGGGYAQTDGNLDLGVMFEPIINESEAVVTKGSFMVWVTAPAGRCPQLTCGFTNNTGEDLSGETRMPGNVATWSPQMFGVLTTGYQLGNAEFVSKNSPNSDQTVQLIDTYLRAAYSNAVSGQMNPNGITSLINQLAQTRSPASLAPQILAMANSYETSTSRTCVCAGIQMNAAWMMNAGRHLSYVEAMTKLPNFDANAMLGYVGALRTACVNAAVLPLDGVDAVTQMLNAGHQPSALVNQVAGVREQLFTAANRTCVCY